jgi:hypothetical protein
MTCLQCNNRYLNYYKDAKKAKILASINLLDVEEVRGTRLAQRSSLLVTG